MMATALVQPADARSIFRGKQMIVGVERAPEGMEEGSASFDRLRKAFHRALLAGCESERLPALHDDLYMQAYRYRRVMMRRLPAPDWFLREHHDLADVVIARRTDEAVLRLSRHLRHTIALVYGGEPDRPGP